MMNRPRLILALNSTLLSEGWRHSGLTLAAATALLLAAGCSTAKSADDAGTTVEGGTDATAQDLGPDDAASDGGTTDAVEDADIVDAPDVASDVPVGAETVDAADIELACINDDDCVKKSKFNPSCETCKCVDHEFVVAKKTGPNVCCADTDCKDQECADKACNTSTGTCEYSPKAACCPGQITFLQPTKFETPPSLEGYTGSVTPAANNSVSWHVSTKRAHTGKSSLYLGNECNTYNTSASAANSCQPSGASTKLTATLTVPAVDLSSPGSNPPKVTPAILHYWLWMEAEPTFKKSNGGLVSNKCNPACGLDQTCVTFGTATKDACIKEKDLLSVKINGVTTPSIWSSNAIDNTTGGVWQHRVVNLAGYGPAPMIQFFFDTSDGVNNSFEGVYLDDIMIQSLCTDDAGSCTATKPCVPGPNATACTINTCTFYDNVSDKGICMGDTTPGCCVGVANCSDGNNCTVDSCIQAAGAATGICKNIPDANNSQCCLAESKYAENFDAGIAQWSNIGSNSQSVQWRSSPSGGITPPGAKDPSGALVFSTANFQSYEDAKMPLGPKGTICSPGQVLPSGTLYNTARFAVKLGTEWCGQANYLNPPGSQKPCTQQADCDPPAGSKPTGEACNTLLGICTLLPMIDELRVTFKTGSQYCGISGCAQSPDKVAKPLWSSAALKGCTDGNWIPVGVPLDQYAGSKGQVCFTFDAGDNSANDYPGPAIDDFRVKVECSTEICELDKDCDAKCQPVVEAGVCSKADGSCSCAKTNKCATDKQCDDSDSCTVDTCVQSSCDHVLNPPTCCSPKTPLDNESFEKKKVGELPDGWTSAFGTGASSTGEQFDTAMATWSISANNVYPKGGGSFSAFFGTKNGNYDTGTKVPYGLLTSPSLAIPTNGYTVLLFHVSISNEWDANTDPFVVPTVGGKPFPVDRLRVGLYDAADPKKVTTWIWSSYDVNATTKGAWVTAAARVPTALQGKSAVLAFEFDAGNSKKNNFGGVYVDNVTLSTTCNNPVCVNDLECKPGAPDICKSYACGIDEANKTFACGSTFKPGPTCCQPTTPLPAVTMEDVQLTPLIGACTPGKLVSWSTVPHKYLNGKFEAYMGNPAASPRNYDDPITPVCDVMKAANPVVCDLDTPVLKISASPKQLAQLTFTFYADIEPPIVTPNGTFQTESFTVLAKSGSTTTKLWDAADPAEGLKPNQYKTKQSRTISLEAYKGLNAVIEFHFDSGDCKDNDKYEGIYIDDVQVSEPCL